MVLEELLMVVDFGRAVGENRRMKVGDEEKLGARKSWVRSKN